jgi:hypothetical protein
VTGSPAPIGTVIIPRRFRGPENSGNGGYTCGLVAAWVDGDAEVILRRPPPLERPLDVTRLGDRVLVHDGPDLVAEAAPTRWEIDVPRPPTMEEAAAASEDYAGFRSHAFPTCFVCGTDREPGDGLRLFAGPLGGRDMVAAPVAADVSLPASRGVLNNEIVWSLLDCPGAWAVERQAEAAPVVLGTMAARVIRPVHIGARMIAVGWPEGRDGRKLFSATALYSSDGHTHGYARQTWIVIAA